MDGWIWPDHDYAWLAFFVLGVLGAAAASAIIAGAICHCGLQERANARPVDTAAAAPNTPSTKNASQA